MIDLHYTATPNGMKIALMLEEMAADYRIIHYDIFNGDQLTAEFGRINPNHKLPALVDHGDAEGDERVTIFESGAILQYLAEKCGKFLPQAGAARAEVLSWLTWQVAGLGPMSGQASHFLRYAPAGQDYAIARYVQEVNRLHGVLEKRLRQSPYVGGKEYSIADMAIWSAFAATYGMGAKTDQWPAIYEWYLRVKERPAVRRATEREDLKAPAKYLGRHQKLDENEWSNMFGEANRAAVLDRP